jgi:hypothetical protein
MSDTDLIRRGDALDVLTDWSLDPAEAIAKMRALPAVQPAPVTVEEAARVLYEQPYHVMAKAFDAMDEMEGLGADTIFGAALRALAGEKPNE